MQDATQERVKQVMLDMLPLGLHEFAHVSNLNAQHVLEGQGKQLHDHKELRKVAVLNQ